MKKNKKKGKKHIGVMDIMKAVRKGNRDAELDVEHGFKAKDKTFKNKKKYK